MTFKRMALGSIATGTIYAVIRQRFDRMMTLDYTPTDQNKIIVDGLSDVLAQYQPTLYLPFNLLRMIMSFIAVADTKTMMRQEVRLSDGEVISLDWLPKTFASMAESTPIVLLVPGLTSDSTAAYANEFISYAVSKYGFRACIMNRRGYSMKYAKEDIDPITWDKFQDLEQVLKMIEAQFPKANIYLAGTSMGANYIQKYAGLKGESQAMVNVKALGCVSSPYCIIKATNHIAQGYWTRIAIAKTLISTFEAHLSDERFLLALKKREIDPKIVMGSQSSDEFNKHFSVKFTTHPDVASYQRSVSSSGYIKHINVPTLAINSKTDLISPFAAVPFDEIAVNPNYIQISVNGGGHLEYYSGNRMRRWAFDAILTYFRNIETRLNPPISTEKSSISVQPKQ